MDPASLLGLDGGPLQEHRGRKGDRLRARSASEVDHDGNRDGREPSQRRWNEEGEGHQRLRAFRSRIVRYLNRAWSRGWEVSRST